MLILKLINILLLVYKQDGIELLNFYYPVQIIRIIHQRSFMKAIIIKAMRLPQPFLTMTPLGLVLTGGNTVAENILRNGQRKLCDENTP